MPSTIPTSPPPVATDFDEIDRVIASLHQHRSNWAQTSISQRLAYLQDCLDRIVGAIVWGGTHSEVQERKAANHPRLTKPITSELGCVTPILVVPGKWAKVPAVAGESALTEEAFCGVLAEVSIESESAPDFLTKVVDFANDRVWGTLSCTVLIDTRTQQQYPQALDKAIANLKYGGIGVNIWSAMLFYFGATTATANAANINYFSIAFSIAK